jgi:hypothetical protein
MSISEKKIANPLNFYDEPADVAHDRNLSLEGKIKTLDNWLDDINLRQLADEENMPEAYQGQHEQREQVDYLRRLLRTYRAHQQHTHKNKH